MRRGNIAYKFIAVVLTVALAAISVLSCAGLCKLCGEDSEVGSDAAFSAYTVEDAEDGYILFSNHIDGYEIKLPSNMEIDMSMARVCAVAFDSDTQIEIYRQDLNGESAEGYINYSNKFAADSKITVREEGYIDGDDTVHLFLWSRDKLSSSDRNYYAGIDIADKSADAVFSILVKSKNEIDGYDDVKYLVES
ncbi:MAG: hypothetical protein J5622_05120, partial [Firmicutes bacterium]|nr:hypothetical protein [Bacillota bacterium]